MIEYVAGLWRHAPKLGLAIVLIAVLWGVVHIFIRSRRPAEPQRTPMRPLSPDDSSNLDSSHIGGPLLESTVDPGGRPSRPQ